MNIAIEISPILAAKGFLGDKSGVYRITFNYVYFLAKYFQEQNIKGNIYLFSYNPGLWSNPNPDFYELSNLPKIRLIKTTPEPGCSLTDLDYLNHRGVRWLATKADYWYGKYIARKNWAKYIRGLEAELTAAKVDIIHHSETGFFPLAANGSKQVITINDLVPILFPSWQKNKTVSIHQRKLQFARRVCDGVICISQSTKNDFDTYCHRFKSQVDSRVIYPGVSIPPLTVSTWQEIGDILKSKAYESIDQGKYFLFYGTFEPRKNISTVIKAFTEGINTGRIDSEFRLILVGGAGWGGVKERLVNYLESEYPIRKTAPVIMLDYLADRHLFSLIKHAKAVVYPSLYEGFGLPVAESMSQGTVVITADNSSLKEVGGEYATYADPYNYQSLTDAMVKLVKQKKTKLQSEQYKEWVNRFGWGNNIKKTLEYYQFLITK